MVGTKSRRWTAAVCVALAGCVGLGDAPPRRTDVPQPLSRLHSQPTGEKPTPDLRIPSNTAAQASDIPLVPVPPPPVRRETAAPANQPPAQASPPPVASPMPPAAPTPAATPTSAATPTKDPAADGSKPPAQPSQTPPHTARQLLQQAAARCATLDSYIVRLTRREQLDGKANPEEILLFKFRKQPFSVHFKWLGQTAQGREVVYVKGRYGDKIHTKLAAGDAPLLPAGTRWAVAPDSAIARAKSRHPITDAGISHCIDSLSALLDAQERGDRRKGTIAVLAPQRRPEYPQPVETLERVIPPGVEPELPRGGRRLMCFDPESHLPMLVLTYDEKGQEVEYYRHDRLIAPANLDDDDFNPDKLWAAPKPASGGRQPPVRGGKQGADAPRSPAGLSQ
ncbi:MAG TPA: DUF1571 domain-containing protein [Gemmataceae bacterium]|jgi:hypothetical protein